MVTSIRLQSAHGTEPQGSKPPRGKKIYAVAALVIAVVGLAGFIGLNNKSKSSEPAAKTPAPVLTVSIEPAHLTSVDHVIAINGSVSAWDPVAISSSVNGLETKQIFVDEGYLVKKGQLLAKLDDSQLLPQLSSQRAKLRADIGNLKKSIQPNRVEDVAGLEAAVAQAKANVQDQQAALEQAKANLDDANQNVQRYRLLASQGAVSAQDYGTRETSARVAQASVRGATERLHAAEFGLKQAQERFSMARAGGRVEDIDIAKANADQTRSMIAQLEAQLALTEIKAPVDGMITKRDVHLGDVSTAGKVMFYLTRDNRLELRAQVPEADLGSIKPGQSAIITSSLAPSVKGIVREISPLIDSSSRLATVRIDLVGSTELKPGSYAEGQISAGKHQAIAVPASAVISKDDSSYVYVLNNNRATRRSVSTGSQVDDRIEITKGLNPGEPVIVKGAGFLKDQDYVRVSN